MSAERSAVTRRDLVGWGKIAAIVIPLLAAIVSAAIKLSADATSLRKDVDLIQHTIADHSRLLEGYRDVGPTLLRVTAELARLATLLDAERAQVVSLEERLQAQNRATERFWSTTWPAMETRLQRIEDKLDAAARKARYE